MNERFRLVVTRTEDAECGLCRRHTTLFDIRDPQGDGLTICSSCAEDVALRIISMDEERTRRTWSLFDGREPGEDTQPDLPRR